VSSILTALYLERSFHSPATVETDAVSCGERYCFCCVFYLFLCVCGFFVRSFRIDEKEKKWIE